jgi:LysM repeat protein
LRLRALRALIGAGMTAGLLASSATAAVAHPESYEVQAGDTLASIAAQFDEISSWRELHDRNGIEDPNLIVTGQILGLRGASTASSNGAVTSTGGAATTTPASTGAGVWDRLAQCESSGNWRINTGNGYYGGLQFTLSSWEWVGGSGYPHQASKQEQIARAEILLDRQGWGAWPACSRALGLR